MSRSPYENRLGFCDGLLPLIWREALLAL